MNELKRVIFFLTIFLLITGCVLEYEIRPDDAKAIIFSSMAENGTSSKGTTRAANGHPISETGLVIPDGSSFGVYAYQSINGLGTDIELYPSLYNQKVTRDGDKFPYSPLAKWPAEKGAKLSFFAYYPWEDQDGIIPNPTVIMDDFGQQMMLHYYVSHLPQEHVDLMYSRTDLKAGYDEVELDFKHTLTWLRFSARKEGYIDPVKITRITVKNAKMSGIFIVHSPSWSDEPGWSLSKTLYDCTVSSSNGLSDTELTSTFQNILLPEGEMLMLPQSVTDIVVEVDATINGVAIPQPLTFSLNNSPDWEMNKIVTYEITLSDTGIHIAGGVNDWNQNNIGVVYDGQWRLSVDRDYFSFDAIGGSGTLTAETNYNVTSYGYPAGLQINAAEIEYSDGGGWLTVTGGKNGDLTRNLTIAAQSNSSNSVRSAKVRITAGNMSKVINIVQGS